MEILIWSGIFVLALAALIISADRFTTSSEKIGLFFKIPPFIIGVTILALGTSMPELATSILATLHGETEIVIGDVVGSNIANILLVLSITAIIAKKLTVDRDLIKVDLPYIFGSTILMLLFCLDGKFGYIEGIISLIMLATYIAYNVQTHRRVGEEELKEQRKEKRQLKEEKEKKPTLGFKYPAIAILSAIALYFAADYTVQSIVKLAELLKVGTEIVAVSAVAIGTSLPELVVSVIAGLKGKGEIALGNVTGSNIFNALGVMGGASLFGTLTIPEHMISTTLPILVLITVLYVFIAMDKQVTRWEGYTLIILYVAFIGLTFGVF